MISEILLKSQRPLEDGVKHFATLRDAENQALLLSSLGRLNRIQAFCLSCRSDSDDAQERHSEDSDELTEEEVNLYLEAISCYKVCIDCIAIRTFKKLNNLKTISFFLIAPKHCLLRKRARIMLYH